MISIVANGNIGDMAKSANCWSASTKTVLSGGDPAATGWWIRALLKNRYINWTHNPLSSGSICSSPSAITLFTHSPVEVQFI
jgi:hypothetical protein